jgi:hypothetical protein
MLQIYRMKIIGYTSYRFTTGSKDVMYNSMRITMGKSKLSFGLFSTDIDTIVEYDKIADVDAHTIENSSRIVASHKGGRRKRMIAAKGIMGVIE